MMNNSLDILSESLDDKIKLLEEIQEYNKKQELAFSEGEPDIDSFDSAIEEKGVLIERLEKLDEGFEALYERVSDELKKNRTKYADRIKELQDKITIVTELSSTIQAQEARNKKLVETYFNKQRSSVRQGRVGSKVAYDYYKNMTGAGYGINSIMDEKN